MPQKHPYFELYEKAYQRIQLIQRFTWLMSSFIGTCAIIITVIALSTPWPSTVLIASWSICFCLWGGLGIMQVAAYAVLNAVKNMRRQIEYAQQLDDLKDQFIASVNHELRNPVMAMMGYLDIIDLSVNQGKLDRLPLHIRSATRASFALRDLINSILDTRRQDQNAKDFVPTAVPVRSTLEAALRLLAPIEREHLEPGLEIGIPEHLTIWGDAIRLQQILTNLLSNAAKYTPPRTRIVVRASIIQTRSTGRQKRRELEESIQIMVRDYGLGIPPDQIPLLFNRFVRLPRDLASNTVGNGLGLYICRVLTEAMGGKIWVESRGVVGEGATFYIQLPRSSSYAQR
jgi:signal transduction histidine kinase